MWKWTKRRKVWDPGNQSPIQWSSKWVSVEAMCASQWQSYLPILKLAILGAGVKSSRIKCGSSKIWCALAFWNITVGHLTELLEHLETIKDICIENQANKKWRNFRGKKNFMSKKQTQCANKHYRFNQKFRCKYTEKMKKKRVMVVVVMQSDMTFQLQYMK